MDIHIIHYRSQYYGDRCLKTPTDPRVRLPSFGASTDTSFHGGPFPPEERGELALHGGYHMRRKIRHVIVRTMGVLQHLSPYILVVRRKQERESCFRLLLTSVTTGGHPPGISSPWASKVPLVIMTLSNGVKRYPHVVGRQGNLLTYHLLPYPLQTEAAGPQNSWCLVVVIIDRWG